MQRAMVLSSGEGRTSRRLRKKIEMLFAHLKRMLKLDRLRLSEVCPPSEQHARGKLGPSHRGAGARRS
jgi:hypothetical protein